MFVGFVCASVFGEFAVCGRFLSGFSAGLWWIRSPALVPPAVDHLQVILLLFAINTRTVSHTTALFPRIALLLCVSLFQIVSNDRTNICAF